MTLVPKVINYIKEYGGDPDEIVILVGGIIPEDEFEELKAKGVDGIFIPGTPIAEIIEFIKEMVPKKKKKAKIKKTT